MTASLTETGMRLARAYATLLCKHPDTGDFSDVVASSEALRSHLQSMEDRIIAAEGRIAAQPAPPRMTLKEFCAEADRLGVTVDAFAKQLAERPEFADCLPQPDHVAQELAVAHAQNSDAITRRWKTTCQYCDGTGDVHSPDGEWRGRCTCTAGAYPATAKPKSTRIDPLQNPMRPGYFMNYAENETPAEMVLRKLACWLGVGGYNATRVDAEAFHRKIVEAIKALDKAPQAQPAPPSPHTALLPRRVPMADREFPHTVNTPTLKAYRLPEAGQDVPEDFEPWMMQWDFTYESGRDETLIVCPREGRPFEVHPGEWLMAHTTTGGELRRVGPITDQEIETLYPHIWAATRRALAAPAGAVGVLTEGQEREAFEKWAYSECYDLTKKPSGRHYQDSDTNKVWEGWKARSAPAVVLAGWTKTGSHYTHVRGGQKFVREGEPFFTPDEDRSITSTTAAASPVVAPAGWKSIDSAPNGARGYCWMLLAWGPNDDKAVGHGMRWGDKYFAAGTFYRLDQEREYGFREIEVKPTHWMPLPDSPAGLVQDGEDSK